MSDVFISYPYKERSKAEFLANTLESEGLHAWLAHKELATGSSIRDQILNKLQSCKTLILLVEPTSKRSDWLQLEYMAALETVWKDEDKLLIPILTRKGEVPIFLRHFHVQTIPSRPKDWRQFSEHLVDTIKESRKVESPVEMSGELKKQWKLRLDELESIAHRIQGEEIIEGAKWHLKVSDPTNKRAMDLLSTQHRNLVQGTKAPKRSRRKKQRTH